MLIPGYALLEEVPRTGERRGAHRSRGDRTDGLETLARAVEFPTPHATQRILEVTDIRRQRV
jgi:hypothetical protein